MLSLFLNVGNTVYCTCFFKTSRQFCAKFQANPAYLRYAVSKWQRMGFFAVPNGLHAQGFGLVQIVGAVVHHDAGGGMCCQQATDIQIGAPVGFVEQAEVFGARQQVEIFFQPEGVDDGADVKRRTVREYCFSTFQTA